MGTGRGLEGNVTMDVRDIGCEDVCWIHPALNRIRWRTIIEMLAKRSVPYNMGNNLTVRSIVSLTKRTLFYEVIDICKVPVLL